MALLWESMHLVNAGLLNWNGYLYWDSPGVALEFTFSFFPHNDAAAAQRKLLLRRDCYSDVFCVLTALFVLLWVRLHFIWYYFVLFFSVSNLFFFVLFHAIQTRKKTLSWAAFRSSALRSDQSSLQTTSAASSLLRWVNAGVPGRSEVRECV